MARGTVAQYIIEDQWRAGLKRKGRDWVTRELQTRAGQPDDPLLDVVFEDPHPTRDFCQRWCMEQDNGLGGVSWPMVAVMGIMVVVIIAGLAFSVHDFTRPQPVATRTSDTH
jgi:hypothetical protein